MAELGMASLLIDLPQARAFPDFSRPDQDRDRFAQTVITVRRSLDYLSLRADIDMCHGALVGFSFGAWIASIVAAVDARLKSAILIAGVPRMSEFWRTSLHPDVLRIREGLQPDPSWATARGLQRDRRKRVPAALLEHPSTFPVWYRR